MSPHRRALIAIPVLLVLVAVAVGVTLARRGAGRGALEASGTVEAVEAELGFTVSGRIEALAVQEGDTVRAGAELARLDRAETQARRDQAAAQAAAARAALLELERGSRSEEIAQARAVADVAADRLADAQRDFERARALRESAVVSAQEFDKAQTAVQVARAQDRQAREGLRLVEAGPRRERIEAARAALLAAEAQVRTLDATLANMVVTAPFAGVVTVRHREPGEIVAAGSAAVTLLDRTDRWVRIWVPETRVGAVQVGQRAAISTDTYPGRTFAGVVSTIASEAEFTPKTVQTREERVKLVYAVKVRITGDPGQVLKPGMPADVVLEGAK
jgi:HlyD family secretion protein